MNSLSWLIYLADVSDNLDWFFFLIMLISLIGTFIWIVAAILAGDTGDFGPDGWRKWRQIGCFLIAPSFFFGVICGSLVPSKETIYAIAASQLGETALKTETGGKAVKALNRWLDKQISTDAPVTNASETNKE
jgi:phosphatidylglycerophosphate synthase